jgi:hypothetical protein
MGLRLINYVNNQLATPAMYATYIAARPAAGVLGRLFISTDTHEIWRDEVVGWNLIADAGAGSTGTLQQVTNNGNSTTYGINVVNGGLYIQTLTDGGVIFPSSKLLTTDSANFFWDAVNLRLGIRTNAPAAALDVTGSSAVVGIFNNSTTASTFLTFRTQTVDKWYIGNDHSNSDSYVIYDVTNTTNRLIITASGYTNLNTKLIVGNTTPSSSYQFDVSGSGRLTGALFTQSYFVAGGTALPTGWTGSIQTYSGLSTPAEAHIYNMGVVGTQLASSSNVNVWGIGVYGAGYTNGGTRSAGVMGDGEVNASGDTGSAIGVRGYATATHSGGLNIGILGDASGSSTGNYGLYTNMASGSTLWANYHAGTAQSYFGGNVTVGIGMNVTGSTNSSGANYLEMATYTNGYYINAINRPTLLYNKPFYLDGQKIILNTGSGGNVLIGTTTDNGQKLQVSGDTYISGNIGLGVTQDSTIKLYIKGSDSTSSNYNLLCQNSSANNLFIVRNDSTINFGIVQSGAPYNNAQTGRTAILASSGVLGYLVSTRESKSNIKPIDNIDFLFELNPVQFNYRKKDNTNYKFTDEVEEKISYGFIADEVEKVNKELVFYNNDGITLAGVEYNNIIAILTKAVQELNEKLVRNNIN